MISDSGQIQMSLVAKFTDHNFLLLNIYFLHAQLELELYVSSI